MFDFVFEFISFLKYAILLKKEGFMRKITRFFLILICLILITCGCSLSHKPYTKSAFFFDTVITITIYSAKDSDVLDACFEFCEIFENTISKTITTSDVYRINTAQGKTVEVSDTTIDLLEKSIYYSELTDGAFDITVNPLTRLWNTKENHSTVPSNSEIQTALCHVDYKNIQINGNLVTLSDPNASIDLGGIAKGYAADYLKSYLEDNGVESALINLGGNVLTIGKKPDNSSFEIGIQKPFAKDNLTITSVIANDSSVVTSGIYERYFTIDGERYHHIIDPNSGFPSNNGLLSATILSASSTEGDALSTACMVLDYEDALQLIRSLDDVEAIFITENYEIIDTRSIKK